MDVWKLLVLLIACVFVSLSDVTNSMPSLNIFIWGFLSGIFSVVLVVMLYVARLVRFGAAQNTSSALSSSSSTSSSLFRTESFSSIHSNESRNLDTIIDAGYKIEEPATWINSVAGHLLRTTNRAHLNQLIQTQLQHLQFLQNVEVVAFSLGSGAPRLIDAVRADTTGSSQGILGVDLRLNVKLDMTLEIKGDVVLDWPVKSVCTLPVHVAITNLSLKGTLNLKSHRPSSCVIGFTSTPTVDFGLVVKYGVDETRDREKIKVLVRSLLIQALADAIVLPNHAVVDAVTKSVVLVKANTHPHTA
eukprot:c7315_g1_i1.p1 GENE.c7315_g1_i1~~c7315_g1_i1.p1  ORF type:complete len:303 (-),score=74.90 c7315_g1_i1:1122-2030(-)